MRSTPGQPSCFAWAVGRVLAAVDLSSVTDDVLDYAARLAFAMNIELVALFVAEPPPDFVGYEAGPQSVRNSVAEHLREEHRVLEKKIAALARTGLQARPLMVQGAAVESILKHAESLEAEWLVLGSHGHGKLYELLVGSVADGVLRGAKVPVVMVPAPARKAPDPDAP